MGHKCKEHKLFMAILEDVSDEDVELSAKEMLPLAYDLTPLFDPPEVDPLISLHALVGFSTPQTLKLIGYIKHMKVIILVDSGSTHNFIHHLAQEINCYIHLVNNFQIMITNGGSMKCGGHCQSVPLQISQNNLKPHMFTIDMGGCDIVLGVEWMMLEQAFLGEQRNKRGKLDQEGECSIF
jgi:hypothetical protein